MLAMGGSKRSDQVSLPSSSTCFKNPEEQEKNTDNYLRCGQTISHIGGNLVDT